MNTTESTQAPELTIEAAFAAAEAEESGLATDSATTPVSPTGEVEADPFSEDADLVEGDGEVEQADVADEFDFEDTEVSDEEDESPTPEIDLTQKVEVKGHGEVTIEELRAGYMKNADYTQGKQALAEERRTWEAEQESAARILEALQNDPLGLAAYLAVETGLVEETDLANVDVDSLRAALKVPKAEEMEAIIEQRVAERLESHPDLQAAKADKVRKAMDAEFDAIAEAVGKPLSESAKIKVLQYAQAHEVYDLKVAFDALSAETARKRAKRANVKATATERPKVRGTGLSSKAEINSVDDALALALALHGQE